MLWKVCRCEILWMNEFIDSVEMEDEVEKASLHRRLEIVKFAC